MPEFEYGQVIYNRHGHDGVYLGYLSNDQMKHAIRFHGRTYLTLDLSLYSAEPPKWEPKRGDRIWAKNNSTYHTYVGIMDGIKGHPVYVTMSQNSEQHFAMNKDQFYRWYEEYKEK